jgi:probable F420-dependent oxidoreductase
MIAVNVQGTLPSRVDSGGVLTMKVRFGVTIGPEVGPQQLGGIVEDLERLRFDSLWVPEALQQSTLDPLVALSFAAARTKRLKVGTHLIIPGRHPVQLARQLAHLDQVSDGRLLLVGVLGLPDEADAGVQGIERKRRSSAMEEVVPLLHRLWAGETVDHDGEHYSFTGATVTPPPAQQPLELWLAGQVPGALRRCGRLGDGWMPGLTTPTEAAELRVTVETAAAQAGRTMDPEHYGANLFYAREPLSPDVAEQLSSRRGGRDIVALTPIGWPALREQAQAWLDAGFSKFLLRPLVPPRDWTAELETLAREILPLTV